MSVKYLIDDIAEKAKGFSRARILRLLNDGQNYLFSKPCKQTIYTSPTTGLFPTLTTVAGTYRYDAPDCTKIINSVSRTLRMMKVIQVLRKYSANNYTGNIGYPIGYNGYVLDGDYYEQILADGYDALESDKAYIIFQEDPGTSTDYYIQGCIEPLQLTAETIPLTIPKRWEEALLDYVTGKIEDQNYGKNDRQIAWHEFWAPKIWMEQSAGSPQVPHTAQFI